jgi:fatty acid desaturase
MASSLNMLAKIPLMLGSLPECDLQAWNATCSLQASNTTNATRILSESHFAGTGSMFAFAVSATGCTSYVFAFLNVLASLFLVFEVFILFVVFTTEEKDVANSEEAADESKWIIYGEVYDLTPWMANHPGGSLVLQQTAGTDCSALFASSHTFNGGRLAKVLAKYHVRRAKASEMDVSSRFQWSDTPAHDQMRARLRDYFGGRSVKAPAWVLAWYAMWLCVLLLSAKRWFVMGELSTALVLGVAIWYASVDIVHCGMHFAIFESPRANLFMAYLFGVFSYLPSSWIRQHNILHHTHTNHDDDPDLHHFHFFDDLLSAWFERHLGFYPIGGWRLTERTPKQERYSRWAMLFPVYFFSSGLALSMIEPPILYWTKRCIGSKQRFAFPAWELALAWTQYLTVVTTVGIVTWNHGAFAALLPLFTFGLLFYVFTQVSHANDASNDGAFETSKEWAVAQVQATRGDYSFGSRLWGAVSGGLHLQSVHHVFPSVHWAHYPFIYKIVWDAAGEERTPQTLMDVVRDHFSFVARLND